MCITHHYLMVIFNTCNIFSESISHLKSRPQLAAATGIFHENRCYKMGTEPIGSQRFFCNHSDFLKKNCRHLKIVKTVNEALRVHFHACHQMGPTLHFCGSHNDFNACLACRREAVTTLNINFMFITFHLAFTSRV